MAFGNFRQRAQRGFSNFRNRSRGFRSGARRVYSSKTLGMKTSTLIKLAVVAGIAYFFKDKIKPIVSSLINKK